MAKVYDLSQLIFNGSVMWPRLVGEVQIRARAFGGIRSTGWNNLNHPGWHDMAWPFPFNQAVPGGQVGGYCGHLHCATHVDAPIYAIPNGLTADKIPFENLFGTGVVIDMRNKKKWDTITAADLEKAKPEIKRGDFVVINTGWQKKLSPEKQYEYYNTYPGLVPSAAEWLIKKKIKAIAGTWPVCDHSLSFAPLEKNMPWLYQDYVRETGKKPQSIKGLGGFEECLVMFLKAGISCVQQAGGDIDKATGKRLTICAFPFRLEDTDASMVRLVGIEE
ncbi:MAG: cyclase family protein [Chloroflexota bacterium]